MDVWDGTPEQVNGFIQDTGVTYTILLKASDYSEKLDTSDDRGAYFIVGPKGRVLHGCDKGYKSFECFDRKTLDAVLNDIVKGGSR